MTENFERIQAGLDESLYVYSALLNTDQVRISQLPSIAFFLHTGCTAIFIVVEQVIRDLERQAEVRAKFLQGKMLLWGRIGDESTHPQGREKQGAGFSIVNGFQQVAGTCG